jgi:hypothetical protein
MELTGFRKLNTEISNSKGRGVILDGPEGAFRRNIGLRGRKYNFDFEDMTTVRL